MRLGRLWQLAVRSRSLVPVMKKAVLGIRIWSDPDPDVWDWIRIQILALLNDPISTFLKCVKAINTSNISAV
jgi:hypothetical protein